MPVGSIDTVIVDDHPLLIKGLCTMLQHYSDIHITATYLNGEDLLKGLKAQQPDVLILDIQMSGIMGDELARLLQKSYPDVKVLVLTHMSHEYYLRTMLSYGILGYVLKSSPEDILLKGIRKVNRGQQFIDPEIRHHLEENSENAAKSPFLTQRELQILKLIAEDCTSNQIAEQLFISKRTVDNHRINLLIKLGAKGSANLIKRAIELDLIP